MPGIDLRHGIKTPRCPDSIQAAAYADGGLIGSQFDVDPLAPPPLTPPQRYQTIPASHAGDARANLRQGGAFTNLDNEPDNLNSYNLSGMGLAPTAIDSSPVHDLMQGGGTLHGLLGASALNNSHLANCGMIQGPGTGTSDSVAAVANGQPVAVSNGEFRVPAAVVQALGRDFFDELVQNYHQPTGKPNGPMPTSAAPIPLQNGDYIVPADVVAALGQDFFEKLASLFGSNS